MAGRKKLPTNMKLIKGTSRKCRENPNEPVSPPDVPRAAVDLPSRASFWFGILVGRAQSLNVGSSADSEMLMLAASRCAEIEEADKLIAEIGPVYSKVELITLPDGKVKAQKTYKSNPACAQRSEALRHLQSLLAEFGLSPASRSKVSANDGQKPVANPFEAFK